MQLYDGLMERTAAALSALKPRSFLFGKAPPSGGHDELILRRDAAFELGAGSSKSVSFNAVTENSTLVGHNEILLYGPDLGEIKGDLPFARIAFILVDAIDAAGEQAAYNSIKDIELKKYGLSPQGYMTRPAALSLREEVRVSSMAVSAGLTFAQVGSFFIGNYLENRHVRAVKLIFVTDPLAAFDELEHIGGLCTGITRALNHALSDVKMDCRACEWKPVCDEVGGMREAHKKMAGNIKE